MRSKIEAWLRLARIEHSFITFTAVVLGQAVAIGATRFLTILPTAVFSAIGPALITAAAFILNDWAGYESDRKNGRKDRPLVAGVIDRKSALYASIVLFLAGLLLVIPLANTLLFLIAAIYVLLSIAYDPLLKKLPLVGNVFIAASMAIPFVYGNFVVLPDSLDLRVVLLVLIAVFAGIGRELIITLRDVKGDRAIGAKTLPMILGPRRTAMAATYFIVVAVGISFIPAQTWGKSFLYVPAVLVADALFLKTVVEIMHNQKQETLAKARNRTLLAMAIGTLAFAGLAL